MSDELRMVFLPYCLDRQDDGRYAVLNRRYKPVGLTLKSHVNYRDYPCLVTLKGLDAAAAAKLSVRGDAALNRIYLYDDGCIPTSSAAHWDSYAAKMALLAKMKIAD